MAEAIADAGGVAVTSGVEGRPGVDHVLDVEADWRAVISPQTSRQDDPAAQAFGSGPRRSCYKHPIRT